MSKLLFQGHGSLRFTLDDGRVIYLDPFSGRGYDLPADFVLITHQHFDHNKIKLIKQKPECVVITNENALVDGEYKVFEFDGLRIEATEAYNKNHEKDECVGYILEFDGLKTYCTGDTGVTEQMKTFADRRFDYAIFNTDDVFTIPLAESAAIAAVIGARHNVPIHTQPLNLFSREKVTRWRAPNRLIIWAGEEIDMQEENL
ncbi:MAG: MBL fold metallo-hydrolase [Clostridiales bacterium]|jgi:L-ascorbate metabolism protein UlaG (beta-lactamase superfamily)|nr:MBL fold metallo-hydrolase [Clostridiales bacterium]